MAKRRKTEKADGRERLKAAYDYAVDTVEELFAGYRREVADGKTAVVYTRAQHKAIRHMFKMTLGIMHIGAAMLRDEVDELRKKVAALESEPRLHEAGIWAPSTEYREGGVVTHSGCAWVAKQANPPGKPGESEGWRMLVKRGRDGKDATTRTDGGA
jgi:hypothetical protein